MAADLQIDAAVAMDSSMKKRNMRNSDLAAKMECSRAYVTKTLRRDSNFSILSLSKLACALDSDPRVQMIPREPKKAIIQRKARESSAAAVAKHIIKDMGAASAVDSNI